MIQKSLDLANRFCVCLAHGFTSLLIVLVCAVVSSAVPATAATYGLATTNLLEGPIAGNGSVFLVVSPPTASWTAQTNASWLHLTAATGAGNAIVAFNYDANLGVTRSGSITISGQLLTITQAGSNYTAAPEPATALVSSGLNLPAGVAVDKAGNVYIADANNNAIKKWTPTNNTVTTLVSNDLSQPYGVAVDGAGNVYIADTMNGAIKRWSPADNSVATLVSNLGGPFGLGGTYGIAVDTASNVYFSEFYNSDYVATNNFIKRWNAASNTVTTLVSNGLYYPWGVAVDVAGNVYIADNNNSAIKKWTAATGGVSSLQWGGDLYWPQGVAVDGEGNVYYMFCPQNTTTTMVQKLIVSKNTYATVASSGLSGKGGIAVDSAGNIYIADRNNGSAKELPRAFLDARPRFVAVGSGTDTLPVVLPANANLSPPLGPVSDQSWLTITGVTNGVVSYAFAPNPGPDRTAHITLLGQSIPITQRGQPLLLAANSALEGPAAGSDSIVLSAKPETTAWTATTNTNWLHLDAANQSGIGSTNVVFSFDTNTGGTRSGTLTIGGQTLTVVQAGASYTNIPAQLMTPTSTLSSASPFGVAVDGSGNLYVAETGYTIQKWCPTNNSMTTLLPYGSVSSPTGVAVDSMGNVYIADRKHYVVKKWSPLDGSLTTLISSGLGYPYGAAVDLSGNVYVADYTNNAIMKWSITNNTLSTLVSGLKRPNGVAVDAAGNVYIADTSNHAIKKWSSTSGLVTALVTSGISFPSGVAVDGAGNVYIADSNNNSVKKWSAVTKTVTTLVAGLNYPTGVAVDNTGNLFIANYALASGGNLKVLPFALVDPTPISEGPASGADTLPAILPATVNLSPPFAPTNNQPWLTIPSNSLGVVSFSFTATTSNRTANVTVLGQSIPVSQAAPPYLLASLPLANGNLQLNFSNSPRGSFTILGTTNVSLPASNWSVLGTPASVAPGWFQFTAPAATNGQPQFFKVRSP